MVNQNTQFKPIEQMEPMEMMTELMQLRHITDKMIFLVQERTILYSILHSMGVVPLIFLDEEGNMHVSKAEQE